MPTRESTTTPTRTETGISRRSTAGGAMTPYRAFQRIADEMDRMMSNVGMGSRWTPSPLWRASDTALWAPDVDVYQKNDQLVIKADLPGLRKDDVSVEITDDAVTIQGERKTENQEDRDGYFRSERSYGSFCRVIPLPEGAIADQAKASFHDGVLEVTLPAPPQATKARKLEITDMSRK